MSREKRYIHHPIVNSFIIFFLIICVSLINAYNKDAAIKEAEEYFKLMVMFFVIILTVKDEQDYRIIVIAFITIMGIYVGKSLWEFLINGRHFYRMGIHRLIGIDQTYSDPNTFAASIVYSLPLAFAILKSGVSGWLQRIISLWCHEHCAIF